MIFIILLSILVIFTTLVYLWFRNKFKMWSNRGIYSPDPTVPIGHIWPIVSGKTPMLVFFSDCYKKYKSKGLVGLNAFHLPLLLVTDIDLLNRLLIADYWNFNSHGLEPKENNKNELANNLFAVMGDEWKCLRKKLAPLFTVGKTKAMFDMMAQVGDKMLDYVKPVAISGGEIELKDLIARYGIDVVSSVVFGIESDSFTDPNPPLKHFGKRSMENTFKETISMLLAVLCPPLAHKLGMYINKPDVTEFFTSLVTETAKRRQESNVERNDVLGLLLKLMDNTLTDDEGKPLNLGIDGTITLKEVTANIYIFFIAGYETSSSTSSFALYELARRSDLQERARREIKDVLSRHDGKFTYESLMEMEFIGNIVNETLRLYPPVPTLFRQCTKDYKIPNTDITIDKGTMVFCPVLGIHKDPEFFEDPETFDPDRFTAERKPKNIGKIYMPFGTGPRTCIGQHMGHMETRLAIAKLLSKFKFELSQEMKQKPIKFEPSSFLVLAPQSGIKVKVTVAHEE